MEEERKQNSSMMPLKSKGLAEDKMTFYIKLQEPLLQITTSDNARLVELALACMVNMAGCSMEFNERFLTNKGLFILLELLNSRSEEILTNAVRLVYALIEHNENIAKKMLEEN